MMPPKCPFLSRLQVAAISALLLIGTTGCGALIGIFQPSVVTVALVNDSDFAVEGQLFYSDEDDTIQAALEEFGEERPFAIPAGGESTFSVSCDDLRAIILSDADLQIIGDVGPSASTDVLRDGDDFECGDRIEFRFDHSAAIVDFDVTVLVGPAN
jgi:hypothetical protein